MGKYLNLDIRRQDVPQTLPSDSDAVRLGGLGSRGLELSGANVEEGKARRQTLGDSRSINIGLRETVDQVAGQQRSQRREGPVQRQAPAGAAGGEISVSLKDAAGDALLAEVLGEEQATDAGSDDEHGLW